MRLSKSKFIQGLGCHRALWWSVHEPDAPEREIGPRLQAIFDQGTRVGELARAHVPGGHLIDFPYTESDKRIEATRAAIAGGARVIYEAAFREDDVFVAVDILHRGKKGRRGWTLTEVKSTTKVKDEHVPDAAVQVHVVERAGLPIERVEVMHLDRACRYPELSNLFTRSDVTDEVADYLPSVAPEVKAQLVMLRRSKPPAIEPGAHCTAPYECAFMSRCWPESPEHAIATLCHLSAARREELLDEGYETIFDLPDDVELNPTAERQRRAVQSDQIIVEDGLSAVLGRLEAPIAHLDFETINPAVPVWEGCRPYDAVPVQFSVHIEPRRAGGRPRHAEWLAEGSGDPRGPLAHALVEALRGARTIIVYHAPFEIGRLRELQEARARESHVHAHVVAFGTGRELGHDHVRPLEAFEAKERIGDDVIGRVGRVRAHECDVGGARLLQELALRLPDERQDGDIARLGAVFQGLCDLHLHALEHCVLVALHGNDAEVGAACRPRVLGAGSIEIGEARDGFRAPILSPELERSSPVVRATSRGHAAPQDVIGVVDGRRELLAEVKVASTDVPNDIAWGETHR